MTQEWTAPAWLVLVAAGALALLLVAVVVALAQLVARGRTTRRLAAETAELREHLAGIERRLDERTVGSDEQRVDHERRVAPYVITRLGEEPAPVEVAPAPVVPAGVFADIVLREGVVQTASMLHGLRRALSPEVRNRARFAARQEVKRSRKARRVEQRAALREWQARRRAQQTDTSTDAA